MENKALAIIDKARTDGALVYAPQNLDCPPLYKAEATIIKARPDEFFNIQGKYMPSKAVVDRIGEAAGVDFIAANCGVKTESRDDDIGKRTVFVGFAQGRARLPDGSWRQSSIEEYEFDPLLRAQLDGKGEPDTRRKYLENVKVGRQRASTGARVRVIRQITGMPVTFTQADIARPLVFSRIVQNTDYILGTKEGRVMAIAAATGLSAQMYGAKEAGLEAGPGPAAEPATDEPRDVTHSAEEADFGGDDFDEDPAVDPAAATIAAELNEWAVSEDDRIARRAKKILDSGESNLKALEPALEIIRYLANGGQKGAKSCADALDMSPLDPLILADLAGKVRGVKGAA